MSLGFNTHFIFKGWAFIYDPLCTIYSTCGCQYLHLFPMFYAHTRPTAANHLHPSRDCPHNRPLALSFTILVIRQTPKHSLAVQMLDYRNLSLAMSCEGLVFG